MAWQEPNVDWSSGNQITYADMNRINGNLNCLAGNESLKVNYTQNDFLTVKAWKTMTARVAQLTAAANLEVVYIDNRLTAQNIEAIEQATMDVKVRFDLMEENRKCPLYTNQVYAGAHYARR